MGRMSVRKITALKNLRGKRSLASGSVAAIDQSSTIVASVATVATETDVAIVTESIATIVTETVTAMPNETITTATTINNEVSLVEALESINFKLKDDKKNEKRKYSRGLKYSSRHERSLKQKNREMAKGTAKISSFFCPVEPALPATSVMEEPVSNEFTTPVLDDPLPLPLPYNKDIELLKVKHAQLTEELSSLSLTEPLKNIIFETSKYQAVHIYLGLLIGGMKKNAASIIAANTYWHDKATEYRCKVIRKYAVEYITSGEISLSAQGRHAKR